MIPKLSFFFCFVRTFLMEKEELGSLVIPNPVRQGVALFLNLMWLVWDNSLNKFRKVYTNLSDQFILSSPEEAGQAF